MLSLVIGILLIWLLFRETKASISQEFFEGIWNELKEAYITLFVVLLLMVLNWGIETLKWNSEVKNIQKLNWDTLFKSILIGVTASAITPFRLGDLAARLSFITKENRRKVLYINAFMASSQLLVTIISGVVAFSAIRNVSQLLSIKLPFDTMYFILIAPILLWIYFKSNVLLGLLSSRSILKSQDVEIKMKSRLRILLLSCLRYLIFCLQFNFVVSIFDPTVGFLMNAQLLAIIFLTKSIIPTSFLSEVAVRISVSYFIFEFFGFDGYIGVVSTFILWFINLIIPSIIGALMIRNIQWLRSTSS